MRTFQYISDLHLEFYDHKILPFDIDPCAEYLLLAGDIGDPFAQSYTAFIENVSPKFTAVFIITGNHEYYGRGHGCARGIDETDAQCRAVCSRFGNVIFLQNEAYAISDDLKVFGTTLWSHIPDKSADSTTTRIADYRLIPDFTPSVCNELHRRAIDALKAEIACDASCNYIILSHHMPSHSLIADKYKHFGALNCAFASDAYSEIAAELGARADKIKAWVYGHTHEANKSGIFYCNPAGYPGENPGWSASTTFEI